MAPVMEGMATLQEQLTGQRPEVLEVVQGKNLRTKVQIRREEQERVEAARARLEARCVGVLRLWVCVWACSGHL